MEKLQQAQQDIENKKKELDKVFIEETSPDQNITIESSVNGTIKSIQFKKELTEFDSEELEDMLILTLNKLHKRAEEMKELEMASVAKSAMPNIPGMF
jgi:DNA-binding protein YbaB